MRRGMKPCSSPARHQSGISQTPGRDGAEAARKNSELEARWRSFAGGAELTGGETVFGAAWMA
jgi:hypothetical protein